MTHQAEAVAPGDDRTSATSPDRAPGRFSSKTGRDRLADLAETYGLVVVLLLTIAVFGVMAPDTFLTTANLRSILFSQAVLAMVAMSAIFPLVVGHFDLSLAATTGLSALVAASLMSAQGMPLLVAITVAIAAGAAVGLVNGIVITRLNVNSIITTLGTASVLSGIALWYSGGNTVSSGISPDLVSFGIGWSFGVPRVIFVVLVVAVILGFILTKTATGRTLYAIGTNPRAAELVGLPVGRLTVVAMVAGGIVAGMGGVLQLASVGSADPGFGPSLLLPALTAVFLGATAIKPGQYNVTGTLIALGFVATSLSGLTLVGAPAYVQPIYQGVTLIVAVAGSAIMRRNRSS